MPKPTFYRLAEPKRKKFIREAYQEFSLNSYEGASITNLVKSLGIAKGSFYQYFEDKVDLYTFLVIDADNQLNDLLERACSYQGEDFFDWYTKLLMVEVKFMLSFPQYAVLFINLTSAISVSQKKLAQQINARRKERTSQHLPKSFSDSELNDHLLSEAANSIFKLLTKNLNLQKIISAKSIIDIKTERLVSLCTTLVMKLKRGL